VPHVTCGFQRQIIDQQHKTGAQEKNTGDNQIGEQLVGSPEHADIHHVTDDENKDQDGQDIPAEPQPFARQQGHQLPDGENEKTMMPIPDTTIPMAMKFSILRIYPSP
jgi:hypothetical protein